MAAHALVQQAADATAWSAGRLGAAVAAAAGLAGAFAGWRAVSRSGRRGTPPRRGGAAALVAGLTAVVVGGLVAPPRRAASAPATGWAEPWWPWSSD